MKLAVDKDSAFQFVECVRNLRSPQVNGDQAARPRSRRPNTQLETVSKTGQCHAYAVLVEGCFKDFLSLMPFKMTDKATILLTASRPHCCRIDTTALDVARQLRRAGRVVDSRRSISGSFFHWAGESLDVQRTHCLYGHPKRVINRCSSSGSTACYHHGSIKQLDLKLD